MKQLVAFLSIISLLLPWITMANSGEIQFTQASNQAARTSGDSASLSITGNMTAEYWIKFDSLPNTLYPFETISKYGGGTNQRAWAYGYGDNAGTKKFVATISSDGTGVALTRAELNYSSITTGTWYHIAYVYTAAAGTVDVYVANESTKTHTLV